MGRGMARGLFAVVLGGALALSLVPALAAKSKIWIIDNHNGGGVCLEYHGERNPSRDVTFEDPHGSGPPGVVGLMGHKIWQESKKTCKDLGYTCEDKTKQYDHQLTEKEKIYSCRK